MTIHPRVQCAAWRFAAAGCRATHAAGVLPRPDTSEKCQEQQAEWREREYRRQEQSREARGERVLCHMLLKAIERAQDGSVAVPDMPSVFAVGLLLLSVNFHVCCLLPATFFFFCCLQSWVLFSSATWIVNAKVCCYKYRKYQPLYVFVLFKRMAHVHVQRGGEMGLLWAKGLCCPIQRQHRGRVQMLP